MRRTLRAISLIGAAGLLLVAPATMAFAMPVQFENSPRAEVTQLDQPTLNFRQVKADQLTRYDARESVRQDAVTQIVNSLRYNGKRLPI